MTDALPLQFRRALADSAALATRLVDRLQRFASPEQKESANGAIIERTSVFVARCMAACESLADAGFFQQTLIVCRSAYESAVRLLWASRTPDGWRRTQVYWAKQDLKWAADAAPIMLGQHVSNVRTAREEVIGRVNAAGDSYAPAPDLQQMLRQMEEADAAAGRLPAGQVQHRFHYTHFYRILSGFAHGHPALIKDYPDSTLWPHLAVVAVHAVNAVRLVTEEFVLRDDAPTVSADIERIWSLLESACSAAQEARGAQ